MMRLTLTFPAVAAVAALLTGNATAAESVTIDALSLWRAEGSVLRTGAGESVFAGTLTGPYLVDAGQGPVPAGEIACIGSLVAEDATGKQRGEAQCRLTADDGAVGFARFTCEGLRLIGCTGPFEFTGGEGRLEGLSGGGTIVIRRLQAEFSAGRGAIRETGFGIASWKELTITMPSAQ